MWPRDRGSDDSSPNSDEGLTNLGEPLSLDDDPFPEQSVTGENAEFVEVDVFEEVSFDVSETDEQGPDTEGPDSQDPSAVRAALINEAIDVMATRAVSNINIAEPVWQQWRDELSVVGGTSPLLAFDDTPRTRIDLSSAHPGGLPQFISGQPVVLSNLVREEFALRNARLAASAITAKSVELRSMRGIESVYLAIGLARWSFREVDYCAPVLLRSMTLRRFGRDFELKLTGQLHVNPQLVRSLENQFGIALDTKSLIEMSQTGGMFTPQAVFDQLARLTQHVSQFSVQPRMLVSTFSDFSGAMVADARELAHPVLDALAGNIAARTALQNAYRGAPESDQDIRPPATDNYVLDADSEQEQIVADITLGNSLVVRTLPGTGATQTIVNALGALIGQSKRVLVVGARRSSLDAISARLAGVGLAGMAVSPGTLRRDLINSIVRNEKSIRPNMTDVDEALLRLRKVLLDYRSALARTDSVLQVSVLDALEALSRLSLQEHPPATTARLPREAIEALATTRPEAAASLVKAAELGQFKYGPDDSPWYGASFPTAEDTAEAHELAKRLHSAELPRLLERARDVIGRTRMREFQSLNELGIYIRLLLDIRDTLDKFLPSVYDRSLTELIAATGSRRESNMSGGDRKRLKKLAEEYVRPGANVHNMHDALEQIQEQRVLWQRYVVAGAVPEVPVGIGDLKESFQRTVSDIASLDAPLGVTGTERSLLELPISELTNLIGGLAAESEVLNNLQERMQLLVHLRELNLDVLLDDLSTRHVPDDRVADELELAWWQSVLEGMLAEDKALLAANTAILDRLEADFRLVDEAHAAANGALLAARLADVWKIGLVDMPDEADRLKKMLRTEFVSPRDLVQAAPGLSRALAPVWMASPYEVHQIPDSVTFDTVFLIDAGATTIAENLGGIRRAEQVVVWGDPVTQTPSRFDTGMHDDEHERYTAYSADDLHDQSALAKFSELLEQRSLTRSYRAGGEDLAEMVNRRFYGGKIQSLPWAGTFLGHSSLKLTVIEDGTGMPDSVTGAVESTDAEVARVVELVLEHAATRPRDSLMVITASPKHAVRVEQSVMSAFARRQDLSDFLVQHENEPFVVATLEQATAQSRDRVIFSIGYGRTPHGRLLSDFGSLAGSGGPRLLAVALTRARRLLEIVSCFHPGDIEGSRLSPGMIALAEVIAEASQSVPDVGRYIPAEPMLEDLSERLQARGLYTVLNLVGEIALAASFNGKAVAVETDSVLARGSLRESLRLRPELLRRLGWHYIRIHAFELFVDPDAVADRIAALIGAIVLKASGPDASGPDAVTAPIDVPAGVSADDPAGVSVEVSVDVSSNPDINPNDSQDYSTGAAPYVTKFADQDDE